MSEGSSWQVAGSTTTGVEWRRGVRAGRTAPFVPLLQEDKFRRTSNPNVAAIFGWLVPGAGQLYIGRPFAALIAFVVVEGLFYAGLRLADGMTFQFLDPELRSLFAPVLSPEIGNLGAFVYQIDVYRFGEALRPWPDWIRLGSALCATSGVLNVCWMVHAHVQARTKPADERASRTPALHVFCSWLVPGLGHWLQGRRVRGACVFALLVGLFVLGSLLADGSNLSRERHFYYWSGQFMVGGPALIAESIWGRMRVHSELTYVDCGLVFGCVAGLLNVLAMIDCFGWSEAKLFGWPQKTSRAAHEGTGA